MKDQTPVLIIGDDDNTRAATSGLRDLGFCVERAASLSGAAARSL